MAEPRSSLVGPSRFRWHRIVDLLAVAAVAIPLVPVAIVSWLAAAISSGTSGIFRQDRIGRAGEPFTVVKLTTMRPASTGVTTTVTTSHDQRITTVGRYLRSFKLDELPQLVNVVRGEMSLIGPRPDVVGYADRLVGDDRVVLAVRPGVTGPATLLFRDEEELLARVGDPQFINDHVVFPFKTMVNRAWIEHGCLADDAKLLVWTLRSPDTARLLRLVQGWDPTIVTSPEFAAYQELRLR